MEKTRKGWRTGVVFLIILLIGLFAASALLLQLLLATFANNPQGQSMVSTDWSGYVVASNLESPNETVVGVNASWTVPRIGVFQEDAYSSMWIGVGGQHEKNLIQVGTEHDSVLGQEYYSAWYELLPDNAVRIETMSISAGDLITASIGLVDSNTNEWGIRIEDVSKGQWFYQTFIYNSSRMSAEWIVERPTVNDQLTLLANFGRVTFSDAHVKIGDNFSKIGGFPYSQVIMTNDLSVQLTSVSPLSADGSSFNVTYLTSS